MQENNSSHLIIIFLLTLITLNLFILDLKVFSPASSIKLSDISTAITIQPTLYPSPTFTPGETSANPSCPNSCLSLIQQATKSSSLTIGSPPQEIMPTSQTVRLPVSREFYIPLGNGSTTKSDWEDQTATETIIDPVNYGSIKEAYFIASLRNPTQNGQVEAQLFNVTDKHPAWGSHVIMNGPASQTITSGKITLDNGNKLYRVQLKSTLSCQVFLDNAKIRIITE